MSALQVDQVAHIARLAVLAALARSCAAAEFDGNPDADSVAVVVRRSDGVETLPVDLQITGAGSMPIGGMSL